nr:DUF1799 domain-containing protein [uncultured Pseudodesulfovibrio sp.]
MWTQWRGGGLGVIGLDYNVLPLVAEMVGATVTPEVFAKVTLLERKELTRMAARRTERG